MDFRDLQHFVPPSIFNTSIVISESISCNADFLIAEISKTRYISKIITSYQNNSHYTKIFEYFNTSPINVLYSTKEIYKNVIIDDYYSHRKINGEVSGDNIIYIFRSGSCENKDFYLGNIVIELLPLNSGVSKELDGRMKIYNRTMVFCDFKYKVKGNTVLYVN